MMDSLNQSRFYQRYEVPTQKEPTPTEANASDWLFTHGYSNTPEFLKESKNGSSIS